MMGTKFKLALASLAAFLSTAGTAFAQIVDPSKLLGIDFFGFFLPWIFTFAIVYGLLMNLTIFGTTEKKKISAALAFVIAFFVTGVGGPQLALFFTNLFGGASVFLAGILVIILFTALLGKSITSTGTMAAFVFVIIIGVLLFLASSGTFVAVSVIDSGIATLIFWLVIIIIAVYLVMHEKPAEGGEHH